MDSKSASRKYFLKPAVIGGMAATASAIWRPGMSVLLPGSKTTMALPLVAGGAFFVAAEVSALIEDYLFPHVAVINAFSAPAHTALNIGTLTAVAAGLEDYVSPGLVGEGIPLSELAVFGALCETTGTYIVDDLLIPMYNKWGLTV